MPHTASAKKRHRQSQARNQSNRAVKHTIKTLIRKVADAIDGGNAQQAQAEFRAACKKMDKAAARRVMHPNTVARRKSLLASRMNKLSGR
jgi:small subunit ribosomal protein S20